MKGMKHFPNERRLKPETRRAALGCSPRHRSCETAPTCSDARLAFIKIDIAFSRWLLSGFSAVTIQLGLIIIKKGILCLDTSPRQHDAHATGSVFSFERKVQMQGFITSVFSVLTHRCKGEDMNRCLNCARKVS